MVDQSPQGEGPRYQPEFSAGERLARLEALIENVAALKTEVSSLEARVEGHVVLNSATENSAKEEIEATRRELLTHIAAQRDAIVKAEEAQRRQADLTREQSEKREEIANERLLALERGSSRGEGVHERSQQISASLIAWAGLAIVGLSIAVSLIIKYS